MSKLNIPSYSALIPRDRQIKSIIDLYENAQNSISSSTSGLKLEVVDALPLNPDDNTIYIVK